MLEYGLTLSNVRDWLQGRYITNEMLALIALVAIVVGVILFVLFRTPKI